MKFTQEIKDKWLEALKSGEYVQGFTQLRTEEGHYCCLGVLCEVANIEITESGKGCKHEDGDFIYEPILTLIGDDNVAKLYKENDNSAYRSKKYNDYHNVIPLIEQLSVEE